MTTAARGWRRGIEPAALFVVSLIGSAALWGSLWTTGPRTHAICGCGDPSLFQWFLAWPAHAMRTGHSLVFSTSMFHPDGINLLSNTSVLALGVTLAPVTWLGGPVLTQNVALLLAVPAAVLCMDLLLRRLTSSLSARLVLSALYGFSPYVLSSLTVSHLMTAWTALLPLIALGVLDACGADGRVARRGRWLLGVALVVQFFVSTELFLLAVMVAGIIAVLVAITWAIEDVANLWAKVLAVVRGVWLPVAVAAVLLAAPAAYAIFGPRSLKGNVWGPGFNPVTGGTSVADLLVPHATSSAIASITGYGGSMVQLQYVGWSLAGVAAVLAVWRWRDVVSRIAAITALACLVLALSPGAFGWAPWEWLGELPVLQNVLQFRIVVFAMLGAMVVIARGVQDLERHGTVGLVAGGVALAVAAVPIVVPEVQALPIATVHVTVPSWWRHPAHGVVLSYPFPGNLVQSPLTWQAWQGFAVAQLGGGGPQATLSRAGDDAAATAILDSLTTGYAATGNRRYRPTASLATAAPVRQMIERDGVTSVVIPAATRGGYLVSGMPSRYAVLFFSQILGELPVVTHHAWTFDTAGPLAPPRFLPSLQVTACAARKGTPAVIVACARPR